MSNFQESGDNFRLAISRLSTIFTLLLTTTQNGLENVFCSYLQSFVFIRINEYQMNGHDAISLSAKTSSFSKK